MSNRELERQFKAVANRKRLEILQLLAAEGPLPLKDVAEKIKLSVKSTHKHLSQLLHTGWLERERRRNLVFYSLSADRSLLHRQLLKPIVE